MPVVTMSGHDYDGQEYLEGQLGVAEQAPVAGQVSSAGARGTGGVGVPVAEPDAAIGVVGPVGERLGVADVAAERGRLAHGVWSGVAGVYNVQSWLRPQAVMAEQDAAGLPAVGGRSRMPDDR